MAEKNGNRHGTMRVMEQVTLGQLLTRTRGARSLREMARLVGISHTAIAALEADESVPTPRTLPLLAEAYKLDPEDLAKAAYGLYYEERDARLTPVLAS